ncbi:hypothetical protein GF323_04375 [Candidatus Woesearchaeota archaeon]|nr:hypothetical protein [Candidatus Woesearchaeota archaeon]
MEQKKWIYSLIFIVLIAAVGYLNVREFYTYNEMPVLDTFSGYYPRAKVLRESIFEYGAFFPLWNPYLMSGMPYLDASSYDIISYIGILNLILPDAFMAVGISYMLAYIALGISMYILGLYLLKNPKYAFLTSMVFMLNGYTTALFGHGASQMYSLSILPVTFLFLLKIFREKKWIMNSVICGVLVALQVKFSPSMRVIMFASLLFALFFIFQLIGKNPKSRLAKVSIAGIIILVVAFGLTAHYILPQKVQIDESARAHNAWEETSARKVPVRELFSEMVEPFHKEIFNIRSNKEKFPSSRSKIGIVAFLLAVFAIYKKPKNKLILFFAVASLLAIAVGTGSFLLYLLWKYIPPWDSFRYANRAFVLWAFSGSILAGFGTKYFINYLKSKFNDKKANIAYIIILILILMNLTLFIRVPINTQRYPRCNLYELLENADALNYIKNTKQKNNEIFRIHDWETTGIDWPTDPYTVALGLEHIFGYLGGWRPEYMNVYLSLAYRNPAKFWGILNVKYLTARSPINITGFRLIKEFDRFESDGKCPPFNKSTWNDPNADAGMKAFGQYLYQNELYLPRAYVAPNSILIVGNHENIMNVMYSLMLNKEFNPSNTVIVHGRKTIDDYSTEELQRYNAIILTAGSVTESSRFKLAQYAEAGYTLLPNIIEGKSQISEDDINRLLASFNGDIVKIEDRNIDTKRFSKKTIKLEAPHRGFLVLSERYAMFEGWEADLNNNQKELARANGVVTAVYLNNEEGKIELDYKPKYHALGWALTWITVAFLFIYFISNTSILEKLKKKLR